MKKKTIVLGIGNPLMGDEGVGPAVVEHLQKNSSDQPNADFLDIGTVGMALIYKLQGYDKAVIIDCALMGTEPGTIARFTPDMVESVKKLAHVSLHEADVLKLIELAKQLGQCPEEIIFLGIEPVEITNKIGLSELLSEKISKYAETALAELPE